MMRGLDCKHQRMIIFIYTNYKHKSFYFAIPLSSVVSAFWLNFTLTVFWQSFCNFFLSFCRVSIENSLFFMSLIYPTQSTPYQFPFSLPFHINLGFLILHQLSLIIKFPLSFIYINRGKMPNFWHLCRLKYIPRYRLPRNVFLGSQNLRIHESCTFF